VLPIAFNKPMYAYAGCWDILQKTQLFTWGIRKKSSLNRRKSTSPKGEPYCRDRERCYNSFLPALIVGHAGDGNFHLIIVFNPNEPMEMAEAERLNERLVHLAISFDGTCTGEHGIGCGKIDFLIAEHGEAVSVMRAIKKAIDLTT
jgi:FAD/FMN-containing dehydrogenase